MLRLMWRDFGTSVADYRAQLHEKAHELKLGVAVLETKQVPGVIVQTFLGDVVPDLVEPKLRVTRKTMPFLFCATPKCTKRVDYPGEDCSEHRV